MSTAPCIPEPHDTYGCCVGRTADSSNSTSDVTVPRRPAPASPAGTDQDLAISKNPRVFTVTSSIGPSSCSTTTTLTSSAHHDHVHLTRANG